MRRGLRRPPKFVVDIAVIVAVSAGTLGALAFAAAMVLFELAFGPDYDELEAVEIGWSAAEVVARLGAPTVVYDSSMTGDYYVSGYEHERRRITDRVFIFVRGEPIAYVYLDAMGRVARLHRR